MVLKSLVPHVVALLAIGGVAFAQPRPVESSPPEQLVTQSEISQPETGPRRLTVSVSVAEPDDLKVAEGDAVKSGQLLADRGRERQRLEAQARQLDLTLKRLGAAKISAPLPPAAVPTIAALPDANYLEEEAAIERAKISIEQAERTLQQKQQEMEYLASLPNLDPLVLEHEQAKFVELQQNHTAAVRDYQLAAGRLGNAKSETDYREYQHSLTLAERVEQANQDALAYQQQWAEYEQRLRDQDFQLTQTQLKLDEVKNAIASLAVIRSPYAGRIRRIKWLGQNADGLLNAEVTLMVRASTSPDRAVSGQFNSVPDNPD